MVDAIRRWRGTINNVETINQNHYDPIVSKFTADLTTRQYNTMDVERYLTDEVLIVSKTQTTKALTFSYDARSVGLAVGYPDGSLLITQPIACVNHNGRKIAKYMEGYVLPDMTKSVGVLHSNTALSITVVRVRQKYAVRINDVIISVTLDRLYLHELLGDTIVSQVSVKYCSGDQTAYHDAVCVIASKLNLPINATSSNQHAAALQSLRAYLRRTVPDQSQRTLLNRLRDRMR